MKAKETWRRRSSEPHLKSRLPEYENSCGVVVFDFLRSLIGEPDLAAMREAEIYVTLPRMLNNSAYDRFVAIMDCSAADEGGVTC